MPSYRVEALDRGLQVLALFSETQRELRLTDVCEKTGIPMATAFRYVKTLEARGFLERSADGAIQPGAAVMTLGFAALRSMDFLDAAREPLLRLAAETGETVNLGVLSDGGVLYLHRIRNADLVTAAIQVGSVLPGACTSIGKVLLAELDESEVRLRTEKEFDGRCSGPDSHATVEELLAELRETKSRGWGIQDQQIAHGVRSIAAPISRDGRVVAGINAAVNAAVWSRQDLIDRLLPPLLKTSTTISSLLA